LALQMERHRQGDLTDSGTDKLHRRVDIARLSIFLLIVLTGYTDERAVSGLVKNCVICRACNKNNPADRMPAEVS
jgi:hypothetical protein